MKMRNFNFMTALLALLSVASGAANAAAPAPVAGRDYVEIPNGSPLDPVDGKVVVEEFFSYICPACYGFEPFLRDWAAKLPAYARLDHIPATFRADFAVYARAYYTAQVLGVAEKSHAAVYDAIHVRHTLPAEGDKTDEGRIAAFYAAYGIDREKFLSTMKSFGVEVKVRRATEHMQRSKVASTPTLVVNGRYLVMGSTRADMLRIASFLIEKEHAK